MTVLVGDVHGSFEELKKIIYKSKDTVIQLGDLGIGFTYREVNPLYFINQEAPYQTTKLTNFNFDPRKFRFIRGNHDNPDMCRSHPNYLGEYGFYTNMFFISGAFSVDRFCRKEGIDWWSDEELSMAQSYDLFDMYTKVKPDIVISHDCPTEIVKLLHSNIVETRTSQLMSSLIKEHKPKAWYFGHHHISREFDVDGIYFKCLDILEAIKI